MSVSTTTSALGQDFLWWVTANHGERRKNGSMSVWWCGAFGKTIRLASDRLVTLQIGDMMQKQVVFTAHGAPDGECDNLI